MRKAVVTGGAGFIASHLESLLLERGYDVTAVDIIPKERCHCISKLLDDENFRYVPLDVVDTGSLIELTRGCDIIYHLAADSDIRAGKDNPKASIKTILGSTLSVCEAMAANDIKRLFFSSTSAVYGYMPGKLDENTGGMRPLTVYGASKLSSEAMISAYSYMNDFNALVMRFPNVVGPNLTHGVIFDFIRKLKRDPARLEILGDGNQRKQYVYVMDLVKGIIDFTERMENGYELYNISTESSVNVREIADIVCRHMGLENVRYEYTGGSCGWKGDVPSFEYDISKAKENGWTFEFDSKGAIEETLRNIDIEQITKM